MLLVSRTGLSAVSVKGHAMTETSAKRSISFGISAMAVSGLALFIAVAHLTFGPLAPQPSIERTVAETAVAIKEAAKRAVMGEKEPIEDSSGRSSWNVDLIIDAAVFALAGVAMALAMVALVRREERPPAFMGFSMGAGVLLLTWLQWIALIICGLILLVAIISNLGEILPS